MSGVRRDETVIDRIVPRLRLAIVIAAPGWYS